MVLIAVLVIAALVAVAIIANARAKKTADRRQSDLREENLRREAQRRAESRTPTPVSSPPEVAPTVAVPREDPPAVNRLPPEEEARLGRWLDELFPEIEETADRAARRLENLARSQYRLQSDSIGVRFDRKVRPNPHTNETLLAKYSMAKATGDSRIAWQLVDMILEDDPENFDARMIREEGDVWPHVLQCPSIREDMTRLTPVLVDAGAGSGELLVRDGLSIGVAFVHEVASAGQPAGDPRRWRCRWDFKPVVTPYGRVVMHYVSEETQKIPRAYLKVMPTWRPPIPYRWTSFWQLQRLARLPSAILMLTKGEDVRHVERYAFPESTRAALKEIARLLVEDPRPPENEAAFRAAAEWAVEHVPLTAREIWGEEAP